MSYRQPSEQTLSGVSRPTARWKRFLQRTLMIVLIPYLSVTAMLALLQRSLIYFPVRESRILPEEAGLPAGRVHSVTAKTEDELELHGWHILPDGHRAADREECDRAFRTARWVVLFFCGNGANRRYRVPEIRIFTEQEAHVLIFDYRGYGENAGSPSESGLAEDARAVWKYATEERNVPPERIILYGESLGGAVAVRLAAEVCQAGTPPAALIVRSTFSSLTDVGAYHYPWLPVRGLLVDRYPAVNSIGSVRCPYLHLHGDSDRIVPLHLGRQLFEAAPERSQNGVPKQFVNLPRVGHNNVLPAAEPEFRKAVAGILETLRQEHD